METESSRVNSDQERRGKESPLVCLCAALHSSSSSFSHFISSSFFSSSSSREIGHTYAPSSQLEIEEKKEEYLFPSLSLSPRSEVTNQIEISASLPISLPFYSPGREGKKKVGVRSRTSLLSLLSLFSCLCKEIEPAWPSPAAKLEQAEEGGGEWNGSFRGK